MNWASKLNQKLVYWPYVKKSATGAPVVGDAVELSCRWEDRQILFRTAQGQESMSNAVIWVDQDLTLEGYLYLGLLTDLDSTTEGDPTELDNAYEIRAYTKIPNVKGTDYERKAIV